MDPATPSDRSITRKSACLVGCRKRLGVTAERQLLGKRGALAQPSADTTTTWLPHPARSLRRVRDRAAFFDRSSGHLQGHAENSRAPADLVLHYEPHIIVTRFKID